MRRRSPTADNGPRPVGPRSRATALALIAMACVAGGLPAAAQVDPRATTSTTVSGPTRPTTTARPGRVAWVTPSGEVVVGESDGSQPRTIATGAVANGLGLAPLAWSPVGDALAYVRGDGALVVAPVRGGPPVIAATDAVVPPDASENILSFDFTGVAIGYLRQLPGGRVQAAVTFFDGERRGEVVPLTDPDNRIPIELQFSPLDPYLFLRSKDVETGREFTIALVDPFNASPFASPFTVDDPVFAPDSAYLYGVVNRGLDQLVRVDTATARFELLITQDRICGPQPSPDGKRIVYAAGPECAEVWVANADGSDRRQIVPTIGGTASFAVGSFSWSLDGATVSHPACRATGSVLACGGPYLDIATDGSGTKVRANARSVRREARPLVKPLKVRIEISGPLRYDGRMLISSDSGGDLLRQRAGGTVVSARGVDERDARRIFAVKVLTASDTRWVSGTVKVTDPDADFDDEVTVFGQVLLQSFRFATFRGVWLDTSAMPLRSGRIDVTVYR